MIYGLLAALTWAFDTVVLSIAFNNAVFTATAAAIALATFTSTFLHDCSSAIFAFLYMGVRKKLADTWRVVKSRDGLWIILAAIIGAPIGMTGYVLAVNNIGAAYAAAISAFFPAWGALLSRIFLKEEMKWYQWIGLIASLTAVAVLGWTPAEGVPGNWTTGVIGALVCVFGWGTEAVIIAWALRNSSVEDEVAMQIRQTTSAISYALVILPFLGAWPETINVLRSSAMIPIVIAAFSGTASYLCYYRAIGQIGAAKAMALNTTYSAWAIPFSLVLLGSMPSVKGIICAIVIIVGAIVAASDVKELFSKGDAQ